jgi:hypothetical protein
MAPTSRKRRTRPSGGPTEGPAASAVADDASGAEVSAPPARLRGEARDELMRAQLQPLAPGERPVPLRVATVFSAVLAVAVLIGATTQHDLRSQGGSLIGGVFIAGVLALLSSGMFNRRYWAVLSFEALLAFQIIVSCLALIVVGSILVAAVLLIIVGLAGWLFWKLVRVMGRIEVTTMLESREST